MNKSHEIIVTDFNLASEKEFKFPKIGNRNFEDLADKIEIDINNSVISESFLKEYVEPPKLTDYLTKFHVFMELKKKISLKRKKQPR